MKKLVTKWLCLALVCLLLCGMAGCVKATDSNDSAVSSADSSLDDKSTTDTESVSQVTSEPGQSGETAPDIASMTLEECFPHHDRYLGLQNMAYTVVEGFLTGRVDWLEEMLPGITWRDSMDDYRSYCITQFSNEPYEQYGRQVEKASVVVSVFRNKEGQEGYLDFQLEFVYAERDGHYAWEFESFSMQDGSKPTGNNSMELKNSMTVQEFLSSSKCQELQSVAFNFCSAYFRADEEEQKQYLLDPSDVRTYNSPWDSYSMNDYGNYGIASVSFASEEVDGETVPIANVRISMPCRVEGHEGTNEPCLELVYVHNEWKVRDLVFNA